MNAKTKFIGDEKTGANADTTTLLADLGSNFNAAQISLGDGHACAISAGQGKVLKCWGSNVAGQLGRGSSTVNVGHSKANMGSNLVSVDVGSQLLGCSEPSTRVYVTKVCLQGKFKTAGTDTGFVDCTGLSAGDRSYVRTACFTGASNAQGRDTDIQRCDDTSEKRLLSLGCPLGAHCLLGMELLVASHMQP